jgi:fumarate reductase subunit C
MGSYAQFFRGAMTTHQRKPSRWPARLDLIQGLSGLMLVLFIWGHMLLESSILISNDAMYRVARFMDGYYVFGAGYPFLITCAAGMILTIFIVHAALAMRKFPESYRSYRTFRDHMAAFRHGDTSLWWLQVWTGFSLFFLGSVHMIAMMTRPGDIGPYESADRIVSEWMWPVYALLLIAVHLHAGVGIYRLAVKWGLKVGPDPEANLHRLRLARWFIIGFFLLLGFASLGVYIAIGIHHRDHKGEHYVPSWQHGTTQINCPTQATAAVPVMSQLAGGEP